VLQFNEVGTNRCVARVLGFISLEDHRSMNKTGSYNDFGANLATEPCPVRISMFHLNHLSKEDQQEQIDVSYVQVACNRAFLIA
jgi:hypothetical protein